MTSWVYTKTIAQGWECVFVMQIDIRKMPSVIDAINTGLSNKEIVEVKLENKGVSVVCIHRTVKIIEKPKKEDR